MDAVLYVVSCLTYKAIILRSDCLHPLHLDYHYSKFQILAGGVLVLALDRDRLADAADIDNGLGTVDGLMVRMVQDPVFENLQGRYMIYSLLILQ